MIYCTSEEPALGLGLVLNLSIKDTFYTQYAKTLDNKDGKSIIPDLSFVRNIGKLGQS